MRPDEPDAPRSSIEVVIVKASPSISKIWYERGFDEDSSQAPDCWSVNGLTPDPASPKKQCTTCAACPMNAWGSKTTEAGKQGKACADSKRVTVVPLEDMANEQFGGPILMRVPAASLKDLKAYGDTMTNYGYSYWKAATKISFDHREAYPKLVFSGIRPLDETEVAFISELRDDPRVSRILNTAVDMVKHEPEAEAGSPFANGAGPAEKAANTPAPKPAAQTPKPAAASSKPAAAAKPPAAQAPKPTSTAKAPPAPTPAPTPATAGAPVAKPAPSVSDAAKKLAELKKKQAAELAAMEAAAAAEAQAGEVEVGEVEDKAPEDFEAELDGLIAEMA